MQAISGTASSSKNQLTFFATKTRGCKHPLEQSDQKGIM